MFTETDIKPSASQFNELVAAQKVKTGMGINSHEDWHASTLDILFWRLL